MNVLPVTLSSFEMTFLFVETTSAITLQFATEEEALAAVDEIRTKKPFEFCVVRGLFTTAIFERGRLAAMQIVNVKRTHEQQRLMLIHNGVQSHEINEETKQRISKLPGRTGFGIGGDR